jgi:hypothetical protein
LGFHYFCFLMGLKSTAYILVLLYLFFAGHDILPHGHIGDHEHFGSLNGIDENYFDEQASESERHSDQNLFVHYESQELKSDVQSIDYQFVGAVQGNSRTGAVADEDWSSHEPMLHYSNEDKFPIIRQSSSGCVAHFFTNLILFFIFNLSYD